MQHPYDLMGVEWCVRIRLLHHLMLTQMAWRLKLAGDKQGHLLVCDVSRYLLLTLQSFCLATARLSETETVTVPPSSKQEQPVHTHQHAPTPRHVLIHTCITSCRCMLSSSIVSGCRPGWDPEPTVAPADRA